MAIAYVRDTGQLSGNGVTSFSGSFGTAPAVGNFVVGGGGIYAGGIAPTASDNKSNSYSRDAYSGTTHNENNSVIFSAQVATSGGTFTCTITGFTSNVYATACFVEYSGIATSSALDKTATKPDSTSAVAGVTIGPTATTTQADELVVCTIGTWNYTGTLKPMTASGFTVRYSEDDLNNFQPGAYADKIVSATGTQSAVWAYTSRASTQASGAIATYKAAAAGGTTVTPGVGALTLSGFAPTVARTANQSVTPGVGALTLSGFAPTVARTANQAVAPGVGALTLTGYAPSVSQSAGLTLTPGVAALALTGYAPSLAQTANQSLTPGVGSLTLTGYAPTISQPQVVTPGVGALSLTGFAPTVAQTANQGVSPGTGALSLTGYAPSIGQTANQSVSPGVGALSITGFAPVVTVTAGSPSLIPGTGVLTLTGYAPTVQQGSPVVLLGGGPGLPRKRRKDGTESYLERLLGRPLEDEEPEQIEVIEQAAEIAAVAPQSPSKEDAAESLRAYGIALKDAYVQVYLELELKKRQEREDEEIAAVIAAAL